jgi:hypothetical protein
MTNGGDYTIYYFIKRLRSGQAESLDLESSILSRWRRRRARSCSPVERLMDVIAQVVAAQGRAH